MMRRPPRSTRVPYTALFRSYFPGSGGGLGADNRQGVWTYQAEFTDLAGNASPISNTLAITFDSIAPAAPLLNLPASEDSGVSQTDHITNVAIGRALICTPATPAARTPSSPSHKRTPVP